jgi:hypothetical protein
MYQGNQSNSDIEGPPLYQLVGHTTYYCSRTSSLPMDEGLESGRTLNMFDPWPDPKLKAV